MYYFQPILRRPALLLFYGTFTCTLSSLSNLLNPCLPRPLFNPISLYLIESHPLLTMIYNRKHFFSSKKKSQYMLPSLSLSLLQFDESFTRLQGERGNTSHLITSHALLHSAPFKVALFSSSLPPPLSHAILPTCVQPVPRGAPPPSLKIKLEAIYGSQQAGKALRNLIFLTEFFFSPPFSVSMKVKEKSAFDQFQTAAHGWYKYSNCSVCLSLYPHH